MPTPADSFLILLIVVVVLWAARLNTLGDLLGRFLPRSRKVTTPETPSSAERDRA